MTYEGSSIDPSKPSIARVYDYLLGGKDNYAVDREIGDVFKRDLPGSVAIAFANRTALTRAVGEIVKTTGIRQFIDLGSGLPTADNVHQVAQRHAPEARVVYVDIDPQVLVHGRALLEKDERTRVVAVDVRNPEGVRTHPDTQDMIDFTRPVAVIFSAILHHVNDDEDPAGIVRYWRDNVPSGSYFFISHFRSGNNPETREAEQVLQQTFGRGRWRTDAEIASSSTAWKSSTRVSSPHRCGAPTRPKPPGTTAGNGNSRSGNTSSPRLSPANPDQPGRRPPYGHRTPHPRPRFGLVAWETSQQPKASMWHTRPYIKPTPLPPYRNAHRRVGDAPGPHSCRPTPCNGPRNGRRPPERPGQRARDRSSAAANGANAVAVPVG